ncbi:glycerate kinase [Breznakia sp. PF5-3]|uniref:glycerate kinase family protein n=1 Tax=unclassified Breznakia TaxID=2623764 RepID=UPI002405480B|nr:MULTISPECIES: glycerate kinase [unclassified Breznakia]MDF9824009.1 glycerate kinase [Breznakia sp. PM6-1]MDF9834808.1 glycerate kinase [Breznakia sp. PF5-3]MDF9838127.1 glycerate kinase [Breznakia sp. PFB2-8]MDF9860113.1 glycerate kinase [Breznakia sp. PH5-24]
MNVFVACDSYKGCMSSKTVNQIVKKAILAVNDKNEVTTFSMGDGGEGTVDAFVDACKGTMVKKKVHDAYFKSLEAKYGLIDDGKTAVIEVASCIGLNMYEREKRHPLYATSYGVGELLMDAYRRKVNKIIIALGGSSTNDGGMGMLQALGARFYDQNNMKLKSNAINLKKIERIDLSKFQFMNDIEIIAACDVKNKLLGEQGATYTFGKQKGLYANQIKKIDKAMENYATKFLSLGYDIAKEEGSGAAGGIGAALSLLGAKHIGGLDLLRSYSDFDKMIKNSNLVITGEGQSDFQTLYGKVPVGVVEIANQYNKPCICISGALGVEYNKLYDKGFIGIYSVADRAMSFAQALELAPEKLYACAYTIFKTINYYVEEGK